ncbi:MAG TPA: glycine cleavage system protein GcvH [Actinomycetota bacterium]|nr:glycine cleavage system protein GcvH [Actinomycetota bacterium]
MNYPDDLKYTEQHEWARVDGNAVWVGITDFAQDALGDVVYVDIPEVGTEVRAGEPFGEVESTKSVSDVYAPVTGTVTARNDALVDSPELVNRDPYGDGWMVAIEASDASELDRLLTASAYREVAEKGSPDSE